MFDLMVFAVVVAIAALGVSAALMMAVEVAVRMVRR